MRFLVIGAGATGGYIGGRLFEAGGDVTFLVRPQRAEKLKATGLTIASSLGDLRLPSPPTVLKENLQTPFDVVILSCKSYDLDDAIESFAPAVGPDTTILPILNGMRHLNVLEARFGRDRVLGGTIFISTKITDDGRIQHMNDIARLAFGELDGGLSPRVNVIAAAMENAKFEAVPSEQILLEMWEKWVFLATFAGITCLTRAAVCDIVAAGGNSLTVSLLEECRAVAAKAGYPPRAEVMETYLGRLTDPASKITASMLGDVERYGRTEVEHILGDMLERRGGSPMDHSLLRTAYVAIQAATARVVREAA